MSPITTTPSFSKWAMSCPKAGFSPASAAIAYPKHEGCKFWLFTFHELRFLRDDINYSVESVTA
jgi:hypothetical protein